jgi:hypothetical protein
MNTTIWLYPGEIEHFVLLGVPVSGICWWLKHRGVRTRLLYYFSGANFACYVLWLAVKCALNSMNLMNSFMNSFELPFFMIVILPLFALGESFCLFAASFNAQHGERIFFVLLNGLMLLLWGASSIIIPVLRWGRR